MKIKSGKAYQWISALLVAGALSAPWTAFADNVIAQVNDVTSDSSGVVEAGGLITADYWIVANSGDGGDQQKGCNASDGSPATVYIIAPAGVKATPSSLTFEACGAGHAQVVSFESEAAGSYDITTSVSDGGEGSYNTNPSRISLDVVEGDNPPPPPADVTAPVITPFVSGAMRDNGWYVEDVTVSFSVVDEESAVTSNGCDQAIVNYDTAGVSFTCSATSEGGSAEETVTVKRDATAPVLSINDVSDFYFGFPPAVGPSASAIDSLSGVAEGSVSLSGYEGSRLPGSYALNALASDLAGNQGTGSRSYSILAWTVKGFYQPVDMGGVINTVKNGSTVPLKFEIFAGQSELVTVDRIKSIGALPISCSTGAEDAIEMLATGGTSLRYDTASGQFIYNWQTPKNPGACYKVTMTAQDGSSISANFKLK